MFSFSDTTILLQSVIFFPKQFSLCKKKRFRTRNLQQNKDKKIQHRFSRVKCHAACGTGALHVVQLKVPVVCAHAHVDYVASCGSGRGMREEVR